MSQSLEDRSVWVAFTVAPDGIKVHRILGVYNRQVEAEDAKRAANNLLEGSSITMEIQRFLLA